MLIAGGAVLIGIFGTVQEPAHTLDELIALFNRPSFLVWISLLALVIFVALVLSLTTEFTFERKLKETLPTSNPSSPTHRRTWSSPTSTKHVRRWSIPSEASLSPTNSPEVNSGKPRLTIDPLATPPSLAVIERTRLLVGLTYGGCSGLLSGLCLLFAKTGVELLILTFIGFNQFNRWQSWAIVGILLLGEVLQVSNLSCRNRIQAKKG